MSKCLSFLGQDNLVTRACKTCPQIIFATLAGYYSLGLAYSTGLMSKIDKIAIHIMRSNNMGYIAIGAAMPTVQWYAALLVRLAAAASAALIYVAALKTITVASLFIYHKYRQYRERMEELPLTR